VFRQRSVDHRFSRYTSVLFTIKCTEGYSSP